MLDTALFKQHSEQSQAVAGLATARSVQSPTITTTAAAVEYPASIKEFVAG